MRRTPVRRTGPRLRSVQVLAGLFMAACAAGFLGVSSAPAFDARTLEVHGATFTSETIIRSIVGVADSPNLFRIHTDRAAEQLVRLPAVESASVHVRLPSTIVVTIVEREPKIIWAIGDRRYAVDQDGFLFGLVDQVGNPIPSSAGPLAEPTEAIATPTPSETASGGGSPEVESPTPTASPSAKPTPTPKPKPTPTKNPKATPTKPGKATPSPSPTPVPTPTPNPSLIPSLAPAPSADPNASPGTGALALPVVFDRRSEDAGLDLGGVIDPVNLDAGFRIAGLQPVDVGSNATALAVVLDDDNGFTLSSVPTGWVAQFGFYAPTVRQVTVIPIQVRDLRSALYKWGEANVVWVRLVSDVSQNRIDTVTLR
ncbi:MAG: cell division protein FtsQ/DivIB [Candidatus Limnocylindrales bacterium]